MKTLREIWTELKEQGYKTDKGDLHSYVEFYAELFEPYRHTAKNVLELGLWNGASMRMWEKYFPNATIHGVDCSETPHEGMADLRPMIAEGTHHIHIGDASSPADAEKFFKGIKFDIVIEDTNHVLSYQLDIYKTYKPYLSENSLFVIEDVQDIAKDRYWLQNIDLEKTVKIVDRRLILGRYDDCLVVIK